jgi:hypothetical protein
MLKFQITSMVLLEPAVAQPHGEDATSQRFFVVSSPILRRRYDVLVTGDAEPGSYVIEIVPQNNRDPLIRSNVFVVSPEIAGDIRGEFALVGPAYGEITVRMVAVPHIVPAPGAGEEATADEAVAEPQDVG